MNLAPATAWAQLTAWEAGVGMAAAEALAAWWLLEEMQLVDADHLVVEEY